MRARPGVLRQGNVEVGSTESERADRATAFVVGATHPRPCRGVQVERRVLKVELRVWLVDLGSLRQHFVMERHHNLEQASGAGCGLGVSDLALDRSKCTPLTIHAIRRIKGQLETAKFGSVARHRSRSVCFDQLHRVGPVTSFAVSVVEGSRLAFRHRRVNAFRPSVRACANAVDNAIDVIAVALGVFESLERDHADAFAEHGAVSLIRERPDIFGLRQRRCLRKAHVHEDVIHGVDTAGDDEVTVTEVQLVDAHRDGRERRRARSVSDAVRAAQVETVCDSAGDDVAEETWERALGPLGMQRENPVAGFQCDVFGNAGAAHALQPHRAAHSTRHCTKEFLARGNAEDDRRTGPVEFAELAAHRVVEDALGNNQCEQLCRVGGWHHARRNTKGHRVEIDGVEKATTAAVGAVRDQWVSVEVVLDQPMTRRHIGHPVGAGQDVVPEAGRVDGTWEERRDANDGNGWSVRS